MSRKDRGLVHLAVRACGSQAALANVMGVSTRKVKFMCAGQRRLWLGRTIPVTLSSAERFLLRRIAHD